MCIRDRDYMKTKVNKPCNVVVIGGGTAGLEAACTAAEVGCKMCIRDRQSGIHHVFLH